MSNSFGYLDIILLGMIAGFIILRSKKVFWEGKQVMSPRYFQNFAEKEFSMPKKETKPVKQNLEVLEGKDKEFLRG